MKKKLFKSTGFVLEVFIIIMSWISLTNNLIYTTGLLSKFYSSWGEISEILNFWAFFMRFLRFFTYMTTNKKLRMLFITNLRTKTSLNSIIMIFFLLILCNFMLMKHEKFTNSELQDTL